MSLPPGLDGISLQEFGAATLSLGAFGIAAGELCYPQA
jgi:hypothetical protein